MVDSIKSFFSKMISFFKKSDENIVVEVEVKKPEVEPKSEEVKEPVIKKEGIKEKKKFKHSAIVDKDIWE